MGYELLIDNKYKVKPKNGFIYRDELTDTLDSATLTFITKEVHKIRPPYPSAKNTIKIDIESFDKVEITGSLNNGNAISKKILLVDKLHNSITNPFRDDAVCNYTLNLFSQTKELERCTLPNLSITSAKNIVNALSIYEYITRYLTLYGPKIRKLIPYAQTPGDYEIYLKYNIDQNLVIRFSQITCPEFQWNNPTLREVLTDLMMVDNCIPVLVDNMLTFIDLSKEGNQIDKEKINGYSEDMTSADYCSELTLPMSNSIGNQVVNREEYIGFRDETKGQLTTENLVITTSMPIYEIDKIFICGLVQYSKLDEHSHIVNYGIIPEIDITNYVIEKKAYDVIPSRGTSMSDVYNYQTKLGYVYYERGNNRIEGFSYTQLLMTCFDLWFRDYVASLGIADASRTFDIRTPYFKIKYKTQDDRKIHAGKYLRTKHAQNRIFDQQTSSYVNPEKMSIYEYLKVNRLGNKIATITGTYFNENDVPKLGDKLDDKILFSRTIQYFDEYIIFEGQLVENYVLKNFFTSVMAKKRSWQFVSGSDALMRHDVDKYYAELSYNDKPYKILNKRFEGRGSIANIGLENYLLSSLTTYNAEPIKYAVVAFYHGTSTSASTGQFALDTSVEKMGDSIAITYRSHDNYSVGLYINDKGVGQGLDLFTELYKYVDDEGRVSKFEVSFATYIDPSDGQFTWLANTEFTNPETTYNTHLAKSFQKPLVQNMGNSDGWRFGLGSGSSIFNPSVYKDNAEIFKRTFQIEFCSDDKRIIIGDKFIEYQKMINQNNNDNSTYKVYWSSTAPRLNDRNYIPSNKIDVGFNTIDYLNNNFVVRWNRVRRGGYCYLTDANDNLIIAFALIRKDSHGWSAPQYNQSMYINLLELRDDNIYGLDGKTIVGNIMSGVNS